MPITKTELETIVNELVLLHDGPDGFNHLQFSIDLIYRIEEETKVIGFAHKTNDNCITTLSGDWVYSNPRSLVALPLVKEE